jgi:hypothetical protein
MYTTQPAESHCDAGRDKRQPDGGRLDRRLVAEFACRIARQLVEQRYPKPADRLRFYESSARAGYEIAEPGTPGGRVYSTSDLARTAKTQPSCSDVHRPPNRAELGDAVPSVAPREGTALTHALETLQTLRYNLDDVKAAAASTDRLDANKRWASRRAPTRWGLG